MQDSLDNWLYRLVRDDGRTGFIGFYSSFNNYNNVKFQLADISDNEQPLEVKTWDVSALYAEIEITASGSFISNYRFNIGNENTRYFRAQEKTYQYPGLPSLYFLEKNDINLRNSGNYDPIHSYDLVNIKDLYLKSLYMQAKHAPVLGYKDVLPSFSRGMSDYFLSDEVNRFTSKQLTSDIKGKDYYITISNSPTQTFIEMENGLKIYVNINRT